MEYFKLPEIVSCHSPNYSSRGGSKVRLIVVHDCEGSEQGSIAWFSQTRSRVSAHGVLSADGLRLTRMVEWENKAWHACDFNPVSDGIEMAGFEAKGFSAPEWIAMASVVAWRLRVRGLPPVWAENGDGAGFCSHRDLGAAGGGHTDPTTDSDVWRNFCDLVTAAYAESHGESVPALAQVRADPPPMGWEPSGSVRHGHEIGTMEWAQLEMNALGVASPSILVDGLYGPATRRALRAFQSANGLLPDGILGPKTIGAIDHFSTRQIAAYKLRA